MKNKFLIFVLICGLFLVTACGKKKPSDNSNNPVNNNPVVNEPVANTKDDVVKEQIIDGLKITNISVITRGNDSTYTADIINTTENSIDVKSFDIILKDADGNEVVTLLGYVGRTLAPNESAIISAGVDRDLVNIANVEYKRNY